jgi:hypothetical protein
LWYFYEGSSEGIWLMYFVHENEYGIFKLVETTIRKGLRQKEEK